MPNNKVIAHYHEIYLNLTETFIYEYISKIKAYNVLFISRQLMNLEHFPFERIYSLSQLNEIGDSINRRLKRLYKREMYFEYLLRRKRARLIHAHFGNNGWEMLPYKEKIGIPLITTFYGFDMSSLPKDKIWQERYQHLFREGDLFLVEGSHMKRKLTELGCPSKKIRIQHIAIDVDQFKYIDRKHVLDEKIRILFCGRFVEKKGLIYAIKAIEILIKKGVTNIELTVIGDGELRPEIEKYILENQLKNYVTMIGIQPLSLFPQFMYNSHIMLQPSLTAKDGNSEGGAPTVLLEAQATGLPIVSTLHADIPEVVRDGKSGFLVPERDHEAMAEKLIYLIKHPEDRKSMGIQGREHIEKNYNIEKEVKKLEQIYSGMI